jgi:hypothetical protein
MNWLKKIISSWNEHRLYQKRLKEMRKKDPYIYF